MISENIINGIHNSRKMVCLITRAFLQSDWCNYEFNIARIESMWSRRGKNVIIIILMEDIPLKEMPLRIVEVMLNETYLNYVEYKNTSDEFFDMLDIAIDN